MRKLHWLFMAICLAVMPALQSCDDNDGYSLGDFTPPLWATVRVTGYAFYLNCDVWGIALACEYRLVVVRAG